MIHVFGNSHAHFFTGSTPARQGAGENSNRFFTSYSLGPTIAYNFYEHHLPSMLDALNRLKLFGLITQPDKILIAVGEVDCRWHIPFQASKQMRSAADVTHECIDRFFDTHLKLRDLGYNVIGWGGHPSTTGTHNDDPSNPVFGDCLSRNAVTLEWSDYLEKKCSDSGIKFISVVRDLIGSDGMTLMEHYRDYCHLDDSYLPTVINRFYEAGLI